MSAEGYEIIYDAARETVSAPLRLEVFKKDSRAKLPIRAYGAAVGFDVFAFLLTESGRPSKKSLPTKGTTLIPTGLILRPPKGFFVQICSRSGLATRGVFVANAPGVIDPDYTGELMILLYNGSFETQWIEHDHRIAQIVISAICPCEISEILTIPSPSGRGPEGLGSTGL